MELTEADLDLIDRFETESGQSFEQFFTDVVHQRETCLETNAQCDVDLQKRTSDFDVVFLEDTSLKSSQLKVVFARGVAEALRDVANQTQLQPSFKYLNDPANYIAILLVDIDVLVADVEGFLLRNIAPEHATDRANRARMFQAFLESDAPCAVYWSQSQDDVIHDAHIWIKTDISDRQMKLCVAEELFNSMGIDEGRAVPSIFDWPLGDFGERNGLSELHLLLLRLLYSPEFVPGQGKAETKAKITQILSASSD